MKDRALRRHQELKAKKKSQEAYTTCIGDDLPDSERQALENNVQKLRKVCVAAHLEEESKKSATKTVQEMKHDITMREQLTPGLEE